MKIATTLSCCLLSPWLLAYMPLPSLGEDVLRGDNTIEEDSFEGGGYDPGGYNGPEDEDTIEIDAAEAKPDSPSGGAKGSEEHEEKIKGGDKAPADAMEEDSFHERHEEAAPTPKKAAKVPTSKSKKKSTAEAL